MSQEKKLEESKDKEGKITLVWRGGGLEGKDAFVYFINMRTEV